MPEDSFTVVLAFLPLVSTTTKRQIYSSMTHRSGSRCFYRVFRITEELFISFRSQEASPSSSAGFDSVIFYTLMILISLPCCVRMTPTLFRYGLPSYHGCISLSDPGLPSSHQLRKKNIFKRQHWDEQVKFLRLKK